MIADDYVRVQLEFSVLEMEQVQEQLLRAYRRRSPDAPRLQMRYDLAVEQVEQWSTRYERRNVCKTN